MFHANHTNKHICHKSTDRIYFINHNCLYHQCKLRDLQWRNYPFQ